MAALVMLLAGVEVDAAATSPAPGLERFYIGTYSGAIYQPSVNLGAATLGPVSGVASTGDPTGAFCIVAGQDSNDIRLYTIDPQSGLLKDTGKKLSVLTNY